MEGKVRRWDTQRGRREDGSKALWRTKATAHMLGHVSALMRGRRASGPSIIDYRTLIPVAGGRRRRRPEERRVGSGGQRKHASGDRRSGDGGTTFWRAESVGEEGVGVDGAAMQCARAGKRG